MKILVFGGSGKIGAAVAWDLVKVEDVEAVGLVGRRAEALEKTKSWIASPKLKLHVLDIDDTPALMRLMQQYEVGVLALPDRKTSYHVADAAIQAGLDIVDMLEEFHRRPDAYEIEGLRLPAGMGVDDYGEWLHAQAVKNGVTFFDGAGFAPGISNITIGEGIRKLDSTESAVGRVGGIPSKSASARHPLKYMITWAFEHVLREYMIKVKVIKDGKVVEVDAAGDLETFRFSEFGVDEALECAITPGMPSFIFTRPSLKEFAEKTVRWPGHWQGVMALKECGLLDLEAVEIRGQKIVPREFLLAMIEPRLRPLPGDTDVCVMWNTVDGLKNGKKTRINYYLWDEADTVNGISSMARVTGFSAAVAALFVGRGLVPHKGIVAPEDGITSQHYPAYMNELEKRGIHILERIETL